uniref:Insulin-like growth factor 2 receptor n=1 Tax=Haemonchus contortus TaxID=6289 RepID=A0A7I4Y8X5_HAECO
AVSGVTHLVGCLSERTRHTCFPNTSWVCIWCLKDGGKPRTEPGLTMEEGQRNWIVIS